jgi:hypothetical protein
MVTWLLACGIDTLAMESTSIYWVAQLLSVLAIAYLRLVSLGAGWSRKACAS